MNHFPRIFMKYFKRNIVQYTILCTALIIGIISGSIAVNMMSDFQLENILNFINDILTNINNITVDCASVFYLSLSNNLKTAFVLISLGLSIIGFPLILIIMFLRGFVLGFTIGFLIDKLGSKGILLSVLSILPQNLVFLPCIISIGVAALTFAVTILKNKFKNHHVDYPQLLTGYLMLSLFFTFFLVISSLIEGYISPMFIKLFTYSSSL